MERDDGGQVHRICLSFEYCNSDDLFALYSSTPDNPIRNTSSQGSTKD